MIRHPRERARRRQSGSALTEFAIIVPVLIGIVYGSIYLSDLGIYKLKAQEIARYSAWSMALRPQSNFEELSPSKHREVTRASEENALEELTDVYVDLNGARTRLPGSRQTMSALYVPGASDIRSVDVGLIPESLNVDFSDGDPMVGMILNMMGIGSNLQNLLSGGSERMGMNAQGQIRARARIEIHPPWRIGDPDVAEKNLRLMRQGEDRDLDISQWRPRGRRLRETDQAGNRNDIQTVLISDDWRMPDGWTAHVDPTKAGRYTKTVTHLNKNAIKSLPGGPIISMILNALNFTENLPGGAGAALGISSGRTKVFSRPYNLERQDRPIRGGAGQGQSKIFHEVSGDAEDGAVENFETFPLFDDHSNNSEYRESLNKRGNHFMGCRDKETRYCEW